MRERGGSKDLPEPSDYRRSDRPFSRKKWPFGSAGRSERVSATFFGTKDKPIAMPKVHEKNSAAGEYDAIRDLSESVKMLRFRVDALRAAEQAIGLMIGESDLASAKRWVKEAKKAALAVLDQAIELIDGSTPEKLKISTEDIHDAERRLGIEVGTFDSCLALQGAESGRHSAVALRQLLVTARVDINKIPDDQEPRKAYGWIRPIISIASAVVVGAAVGAPLAAFVVHEPILKEMVKAGITGLIGVAGEKVVEGLMNTSSGTSKESDIFSIKAGSAGEAPTGPLGRSRKKGRGL